MAFQDEEGSRLRSSLASYFIALSIISVASPQSGWKIRLLGNMASPLYDTGHDAGVFALKPHHQTPYPASDPCRNIDLILGIRCYCHPASVNLTGICFFH